MGRTILVADDSPTVQKKASGILTGEGLEVVTVSNGVAAVKKLPSVNPLVVLADVSMPGKDGYEVCEHIKSTASLSHVSVVLIFSETDPYEEARGSRVNADGRIKKPFDREELVATVAKFVALAEAAAHKPAPAPAAPPAAFEVEPMDEAPEEPVKPQGPDFSSFSGGVAFGVPAAEEIPSVPEEPMLAEPMPAETLSPEPAATFEEPAVSPEAAVEAIAESAPAVAEPEPALVTEPLLEDLAPEPAPETFEPVLVEEESRLPRTPEPSAERTMMFRAPADIAQPIFSDEIETSAPAAEAPEAPVAEPPQAVETVPEPEPAPAAAIAPAEAPALETDTAAAESESATEAAPAGTVPLEPTHVASQTLEGYTLNQAAAGEVRFAPAETEASHPVEPEPAPGVAEPRPEAVAPAPEAAPPLTELAAPPDEPPAPASTGGPDTAIAPERVFTIVHKVVVKMSPPALSPQMVEDIARKFADEITAELNSES